MATDLLNGAWRSSPPVPELSAEQLAVITPLLTCAGSAPLGWWKVRYSALRTCEAAAELQGAYRSSILQSALHERDIEQVQALLSAAKIESILIKGWAIAQLYPEQGLRPYSDIDLCVRPDHLPLAESILNRPENKKYFVELEHDEVHTIDVRSWDELFARSQLLKLGETNVRTPSAEDHLRLLCLHLLKHGVCSPRWLCDVALAVENRPADFDWQRCLGGNRRQADWIACAIGLAHQLLGARIENTPAAERAMRLPRWLVPQVLKRWGATHSIHLSEHQHQAPMRTYLRRPFAALKDIRARWPDPIEATIHLRGSFDELPRLPFQLGECFSRTAKFVADVPRAQSERH